MRPHGLLIFGLAAAFGMSLSAQAFADHAAAIAGASAGVAGARALRDPLSRILQSASEVATPAPEATRAETKPAMGVTLKSAGTQPSPQKFVASPSGTPAWRRGSANRRPASASEDETFSTYESASAAPQVTTAQLKTVASGATRSDVIGSLGVPAARITMDDNGHLVEILQYSANGVRVGSVRCTDGRVESVNTADR